MDFREDPQPAGNLAFENGLVSDADSSMNSNHELDRILKAHNLLILQIR